MTIPGENLNARSWLFAPGDSERKWRRPPAVPLTSSFFDLEDAVAEA